MLQTLQAMMAFASCKNNMLLHRIHNLWRVTITDCGNNNQHQRRTLECTDTFCRLGKIPIWVGKKSAINLFVMLSEFESEVASDERRFHSTLETKDICWDHEKINNQLINVASRDWMNHAESHGKTTPQFIYLLLSKVNMKTLTGNYNGLRKLNALMIAGFDWNVTLA